MALSHLVSACLAAAGLLVAVVPSASGAPSAPHGVLAVEGGLGVDRHTVVLNVHDGSATAVGPRGDRSLAFALVSPDGKHLAYQDARGLWMSGIDGTRRVQLDPTWKEGQGGRWAITLRAWSSDGRSLLFTLFRDHRNSDELLETRIDTGATRTLFWKSGFDVESLTVSPDGRTIAFVSRSCCSGGARYRGIYIIDAHGSHIRHLARLFSADGGSPTWAPDGRSLAFVDLSPGAHPGSAPVYDRLALFRIEPSGAERHLVRAFGSGTTIVSTAWSPDGKQFVLHLFNVDSWPAAETDGLFVMDADGTRLRLLSRTASIEDPVQWR